MTIKQKGGNYWAILFFIIVCIGAVFYFFSDRLNDQRSMNNDQLPEGIVVEDLGGGEKVVINKIEDLRIKIDDSWSVPNQHLSDEKIAVEKLGPNNQDDTDMGDGVYMKLYTHDNSNQLSIRDWILERSDSNDFDILEINDTEVAKITDKVSFGVEDPIVMEDSLITNFYFTRDNIIFIYSCVAAGSDYLEYSSQCQKLVEKNI